MPGADALAEADLTATDDRICRVALTVNEIQQIREFVNADDPLALQEVIDFFELKARDLDRLVDQPFTAKPFSSSGKPFPESRFSDGSFPVFYSALERETACAEYAHYAPKYFTASLGKIELRLHVIGVHFVGSTRDLRAASGKFPGLVTEDHNFCREVGVAAYAQNLDGLIAKSVRRPTGSNLPILRRSTLSEPQELGKITFHVDATAGTATFDIDP